MTAFVLPDDETLLTPPFAKVNTDRPDAVVDPVVSDAKEAPPFVNDDAVEVDPVTPFGFDAFDPDADPDALAVRLDAVEEITV